MLRRNSSIGEFDSYTVFPSIQTHCFVPGLFNEDDILFDGFNEDGSFIGDYTQNSHEETQAVLNKQLYFANFLNKDSH